MSGLLSTLQHERNTLMEVYESSRKDVLDEANLVDIYQRHFRTQAPPVTEQPPVFEKVSLADPTIKTFLRSTTDC
jgi:hypothetical protein